MGPVNMSLLPGVKLGMRRSGVQCLFLTLGVTKVINFEILKMRAANLSCLYKL